jgi:UDP-N-acetylglucosamine:LPS N-acetylglucosamine transferase
MKTNGPVRIMVTLGEGGHSTEMLTLVDMLGEGISFSYLIVHDDPISEGKIKRPGPVCRVRRPRDKDHHLLRDVGRSLQSAWEAWRALRRIRPHAILSSGPSMAVPACVMAKLMGVRVIFVETSSRVTFLSLTGRIVYRFADLYFVQWPQLHKVCPRATFAGRLL